MKKLELAPNVFYVGVQDWSRRVFDELIPLPDGTSYNSYLIYGSEKTALIDTVDPSKREEFLKNLNSLGLKKLDYIISNHAEQDHSGLIPEVIKMFPEAVVVTNKKCKEMLMDLLPSLSEENFMVVEDGDTLSLGDKTLEFIFTPWVHWPETMSTYLVEDEILFSCDFFGSHRATNTLFVYDEYKVIEDAKRYYAEIMMPFRNQIRKNIEKIERKTIKFIAPSHGPVYDKPEIIISAYKEWVSDKIENKVIIPYVSMHDSTKEMVFELTRELTNYGIRTIPMNLTVTDIGVLAMELVDSKTIVFGTPYVLTGAHPLVVYSAYLINALRPKTKYIGFLTSYGWGGKGVEQLKGLLSNVKAQFLEPVLSKGYPKKDEIEKIKKLADKIKEKHSE